MPPSDRIQRGVGHLLSRLKITMVVVQLATGSFSPRIVQRILRDKPSQLRGVTSFSS